MGELHFAATFGGSIFAPSQAWFDFIFNKTYVEVKDCRRRFSGRFVCFVDYHDILVKHSGWYYFVLKAKHARWPERIIHTKFMPACTVNIDEHRIRVRRDMNYDDREVIDISWKKIFPELIK